MAQHDGHRQRMKSKMLNHSESLVAHEVIETLLYYSIPRKNVNELAHKLLDRFSGSIKTLLDADPVILQTVDGVGENTACFIKTIGRIVQFIEDEKYSNKRISNIFDAQQRIKEYFVNANKEIFIMFFLGADSFIIGKAEFSSNKTDRVELDLDEIERLLVLHKPSAVVVAHNHLSGNSNPSLEDNSTTKRIYSFLSVKNITFYDHLIYSEKDIYSYKEHGLLDKIKEDYKRVIC